MREPHVRGKHARDSSLKKALFKIEEGSCNSLSYRDSRNHLLLIIIFGYKMGILFSKYCKGKGSQVLDKYQDLCIFYMSKKVLPLGAVTPFEL
ncbi:MAG TPA: hypothetical protein ENJ53_07340 [Phaeodactylibacter sp.]|nr:hypothetical protein [Phaeodactylibacter sp.]